MMVCLDTSFVIDILRGNKEIKNKKEEFDESGEIFYVPSPVIIELISGANNKGRKEEETKKIKEFLSSIMVLPLDKESAILAGEIEAGLKEKGIAIELEDIMIAAISIKNNEALVTRNLKHFEKIPGLQIEGY